MANELLDFKNEKKKAYIDKLMAESYLQTPGTVISMSRQLFFNLIDDAFNAAFDFGLDSLDLETAENKAFIDRENRIAQVRRTALELAKTNLPEFLYVGDNLQELVIMALRFESLLDNIVK